MINCREGEQAMESWTVPVKRANVIILNKSSHIFRPRPTLVACRKSRRGVFVWTWGIRHEADVLVFGSFSVFIDMHMLSITQNLGLQLGRTVVTYCMRLEAQRKSTNDTSSTVCIRAMVLKVIGWLQPTHCNIDSTTCTCMYSAPKQESNTFEIIQIIPIISKKIRQFAKLKSPQKFPAIRFTVYLSSYLYM